MKRIYTVKYGDYETVVEVKKSKQGYIKAAQKALKAIGITSFIQYTWSWLENGRWNWELETGGRKFFVSRDA